MATHRGNTAATGVDARSRHIATVHGIAQRNGAAESGTQVAHTGETRAQRALGVHRSFQCDVSLILLKTAQGAASVVLGGDVHMHIPPAGGERAILQINDRVSRPRLAVAVFHGLDTVAFHHHSDCRTRLVADGIDEAAGMQQGSCESSGGSQRKHGSRRKQTRQTVHGKTPVSGCCLGRAVRCRR